MKKLVLTVLVGLMFWLGDAMEGYGYKRPLPPPVIVVRPVPQVEVYRWTPYWMVVPKYEFRYRVRYPLPARARSYRRVYVAWPWPVYMPYGGAPSPIGGELVGGEPLSNVFSPSVPGGPVGEGSPPEQGAGPNRGAGIPGPLPAPEAEELPELIPPPMPQPDGPSLEPKP